MTKWRAKGNLRGETRVRCERLQLILDPVRVRTHSRLSFRPGYIGETAVEQLAEDLPHRLRTQTHQSQRIDTDKKTNVDAGEVEVEHSVSAQRDVPFRQLGKVLLDLILRSRKRGVGERVVDLSTSECVCESGGVSAQP